MWGRKAGWSSRLEELQLRPGGERDPALGGWLGTRQGEECRSGLNWLSRGIATARWHGRGMTAFYGPAAC